MAVDANLTRLSIQGYVDRAKAEGHHPSEPFAIPLALAEWEALLKAEQPEAATLTEIGVLFEIPDGFDGHPNTIFCEWNKDRYSLPAGTKIYAVKPSTMNRESKSPI